MQGEEGLSICEIYHLCIPPPTTFTSSCLPFPLQVVKFNSEGETWVENGPYCPPLSEEEEPTEPEAIHEEEKEEQSRVPEAAIPIIEAAPKESPKPKKGVKVSFSQDEPFRSRTNAIVDEGRKMSYPFVSRPMSACYAAPPVAVSNSFICPPFLSVCCYLSLSLIAFNMELPESLQL